MMHANLDFAICYALISPRDSLYAEQCIISIYSLRRIHPEAKIIIYTDKATFETFHGSRKALREQTDKIVIKEFEDNVSNLVRSRILKTTLPDVERGNLLYVDSDTIFRREIAGLNTYLRKENPLYAVRDGHRSMTKMSAELVSLHQANAEMLGYKIEDEKDNFFNGGMMLIKDCETSRMFYQRWHNNYLHYLKEKGIHTDQATLCLTNRQLGHIIVPIGKEYNFQVASARNGLGKSRILHYFATVNIIGDAIFPLQDNRVLEEVARTGKIPVIVKECIENPVAQIDYLSLTYGMIKRSRKLTKMVNRWLQPLYVLRSFICKL